MSIKNRQGELWGTAPEDWALHLEITFIPVYKKVINKAGLAANDDVLDIGCGSGLFIKMLDVTNSSVTGIDVSEELLNVARQRNPGATLVNQDMNELPFADNSFNLVTGFNSIQYAEDLPKTLSEIKRVLKDDGKLVISTWGSANECEALKVLASIATLLPEPVAGSPGPLALSAAGKVEVLLAEAGFKIIENNTIECPWNFSSLDDAIKGILAAGPSAEAISYAGKEKVKEKLISSLEPFNVYDEIYFLENVYHYYIAAKA
ncbi:MAG: class I SAM-dependent methyltransferase [Ferruginibacter sp.]